jgi:hypothetical protein
LYNKKIKFYSFGCFVPNFRSLAGTLEAIGKALYVSCNLDLGSISNRVSEGATRVCCIGIPGSFPNK